MHKLLWLELNWNLVFFLVAVVVSIVVIVKLAQVAGLLLLSLVLYLGVDWDMWSWVPPLFWIAWFGGLIFVVLAIFTSGGGSTARLLARLCVAILAIAVVFNGIGSFVSWLDDEPSTQSSQDSGRDKNTDDGDESKCADTWRMKESTPENGDWVTEVPSIKSAQTKAEARAAANDWVDLVKRHPETLKGAAAFILDKKVDANALVSDEGCATNRADDLVTEIKVALAASLITPDQAPVDGRNSGTDPQTGEVYAYNFVGVDGDRKAIKVVLPNGQTVWIMYRCGNPVVTTPPPVHQGCKEGCNPPPPRDNCKDHPTTPECLTPKDPSQDPMNNPDVPDQVKGPGTTPPNGNPGPATQPHDTDTGCQGSCSGPNPTPNPDPTPTPEPDNPPEVQNDPPVTGTVDPPPPPPPGD